MADMPDLDPENVSWIAWWNLMDHSDPIPDSINPEDTLSAYSFESTEYYDNGIVAEWNPEYNQSVYIRVKSDGWFVAYTKREQNHGVRYTYDVRAPPDEFDFYGDYMIFGGRTQNYGVDNNILSTPINQMASRLSVWSDVFWDYPDVGLYNYRLEGSKVALLRENGGGTNNRAWYYSGEQPKYVALNMQGHAGDYSGNSAHFYDEFLGIDYHMEANDAISVAKKADLSTASADVEYAVEFTEDADGNCNIDYIGVY